MKEDKISSCLKKYKTEQKKFENHWLWRELNMSPKEFFEKVKEYVDKSGIDKRIWDQKLKEAKKALQVRMNEKQGEYKKVDFKKYQGSPV